MRNTSRGACYNQPMQNLHFATPPDAAGKNLVDRFAPAGLQPYLRLARLDRPIGSWLLFWPCAWSLVLALTPSDAPAFSPHHLWLLLLLALGSVFMRGAGCSWNDFIDRDIDRKVQRSHSRPLAAGSLAPGAALAFLALQLLAAFVIVLQFNIFTIFLCLAVMPLVCFYPFAKRITPLPQLFLGITFGWGALAGWSAVAGSLAWPVLFLYAACIAWIIGYDTIYAMQDKEDDALLSLGSSALLWGEASRRAVAVCYGVAFLALLGAAYLAGSGALFYACLPLIGAHFVWQVARLDTQDPALCLRLFQSNRELGCLVLLALAGGLWSAPSLS